MLTLIYISFDFLSFYFCLKSTNNILYINLKGETTPSYPFSCTQYVFLVLKYGFGNISYERL